MHRFSVDEEFDQCGYGKHMDMLKGRYEIQSILAESYGKKTLLARDGKAPPREEGNALLKGDGATETLVVVKLLIFHSELKWETAKLFEREANTLKSLDHPAIPHYLDYFDVETALGKGFALVQSFIDADSLAQQISVGRRFSEAELIEIAGDVLGVLTYLHSCNPPVIHRDIKPSNILLSTQAPPAQKLSLIDFGAVQAMQSEGGTRTVVGTYGYMPPEQFGDRAVPASDLYGLGMTLIYLASGQQPADLPQKNLRVQFEHSVSLSPLFVQWLQKMTLPALDERFQSAAQALQSLEMIALAGDDNLSGPFEDWFHNMIDPAPKERVVSLDPIYKADFASSDGAHAIAQESDELLTTEYLDTETVLKESFDRLERLWLLRRGSSF